MNASPLRESRGDRLGARQEMRATKWVARVRVHAMSFAVWAAVGASTSIAAGVRGAQAQPEVDAAVLIAAPVAPSAFTDGWDTGFGFGGGVRWPLGARLRLGIEGKYLQFAPASRGTDGLGGNRRSGGAAVPVSFRLGPADTRVGGELVASVGYGHESIETLSGSMHISGGSRDGVAWSAGGALTYGVGGLAKLLADVRVGGIAGGGESSTQVVLRLGIRAGAPEPSRGARSAPQSGSAILLRLHAAAGGLGE
jgi:hypothetical protein